MLIGEYLHKMDSKGRLIIPAKFREELGDNFVATRGLDNCLFIFPMDEWEQLSKKIANTPVTNKNARFFARFFISGATESTLDKQGRINIPTNLKEYAELEKDIVVIGLTNRIELWAKENWDQFLETTEDSTDEIAAAMEDLGI
ncbi:MAG: division/cell wall cluster transcriptional repressor MraZ [Halanaerobiales bacterium]|jgi:MraZ protein|nr:division/cell wall cluster transcriptional repressor MraZ [Halanaerobiales bacterium]